MKAGLALALAALLAAPAAAQRRPAPPPEPPPIEEGIVASTSDDYIEITSSFTGAELVVFGAIESPDPFKGAEGRDLVIVVRGPKTNVTVREKARVAGVWVNADAAVVPGAPGFYFVASTRPLAEIAEADILERRQIGIANLDWRGPDRPDGRRFVDALVASKAADGLYAVEPGRIDLSAGALFQTRVRMPANVPIGSYTVEAYLFRDGLDVASYSLPLTVDKSGVERWIFASAHDHGMLYGAAAILMAILLGGLAALVFRER